MIIISTLYSSLYIIQIIKSTFNNEILLIHLSKINNIETEDRLLRLQNAYRGVLNLLFYSVKIKDFYLFDSKQMLNLAKDL